MDIQDKKEQTEPIEKKESLRVQFYSLPQAIQFRIVKQFLAAIAVLAVALILTVYFKSWEFCLALFFALYFIWLGFKTMWDFQEGKIICQTMVCIKAVKVPGAERVFVLLKETENPEQLHQFYISASKKQISLISPNTIMRVYYRPENPLEITAWEITDYIGKE